MFETIGTILKAITRIVNSLVGITTSIDHVVTSCNHATQALERTARELDEDVAFTCQKKQAERRAAMAAYQAELDQLALPN